ncbi:Putative ribonuclease H protein At1g65750, partial [Linum perenne]
SIIDRLDSKLTCWKAKSLSLARRVTLAKSALTAILKYTMQTLVLPVNICESINRRIRDFFWGSTSEERMMHLISWEQICKLREMGGLGLRQTRDLNIIYMIKMCSLSFRILISFGLGYFRINISGTQQRAFS